MTISIDVTHDVTLQSWVESANDSASEFPIQNLPFGRFKLEEDSDWRIGVAIGDQMLDLRRAGVVQTTQMNQLMNLPVKAHQPIRAAVSKGLRTGSAQEAVFKAALSPQIDVRMGLPCDICD